LNITPTGSVGIGTSAPGYKLDVQGGDINASGSVRSATVALTSDKRWKKDIHPLENSIQKLKQINGVSYLWDRENFPEKLFNDQKQIGVIAQDVQKVYPELILKDTQGFLSVNYPALIAPLIEAFKEQQKQIEINQQMMAIMQSAVPEIRRDIAALKDENVSLKKKVMTLEERIQRLEKLIKTK